MVGEPGAAGTLLGLDSEEDRRVTPCLSQTSRDRGLSRVSPGEGLPSPAPENSYSTSKEEPPGD